MSNLREKNIMNRVSSKRKSPPKPQYPQKKNRTTWNKEGRRPQSLLSHLNGGTGYIGWMCQKALVGIGASNDCGKRSWHGQCRESIRLHQDFPSFPFRIKSSPSPSSLWTQWLLKLLSHCSIGVASISFLYTNLNSNVQFPREEDKEVNVKLIRGRHTCESYRATLECVLSKHPPKVKVVPSWKNKRKRKLHYIMRSQFDQSGERPVEV